MFAWGQREGSLASRSGPRWLAQHTWGSRANRPRDDAAEKRARVKKSRDTLLGFRAQVFRSAILKGAADPIKNAYADVADKYADVLRLEQSVAELHQMFVAASNGRL